MFNPGDTAYLTKSTFGYTGKVNIDEVVTIKRQTKRGTVYEIKYQVTLPYQSGFTSSYVDEADLTAYKDRYFIRLEEFTSKQEYAKALFKGNIHYWTEEQEEFVLSMYEEVTQDFGTIVAAFEAQFGIFRTVGAISSRLEKIK